MIGNPSFIVIPGRLNVEFAEQVCKLLNVPVHPITYKLYSNNEYDVTVSPPVRNKTVFILVSPYPELDRQLMELLLTVDAVRRGAAKRIIVLLTLFPHSVDTLTKLEREELKEKTKELKRFPEEQLMRIQSGRLLANLLEGTGVDEVQSVELREPQWEGLFSIPFTNLACHEVLAEVIDKHLNENLITDNVLMVPFQLENSKRCDRIIKNVKKDIVKALTFMRKNGEILCDQEIDFTQKHAFIITDFMRSSEGVIDLTKWLQCKGVIRVTIITIHALLGSYSIMELENESIIDCVYLSDSLSLMSPLSCKFKVYSISRVIAKGINAIVQGHYFLDLEVTD